MLNVPWDYLSAGNYNLLNYVQVSISSFAFDVNFRRYNAVPGEVSREAAPSNGREGSDLPNPVTTDPGSEAEAEAQAEAATETAADLPNPVAADAGSDIPTPDAAGAGSEAFDLPISTPDATDASSDLSVPESDVSSEVVTEDCVGARINPDGGAIVELSTPLSIIVPVLHMSYP